MPSRAQWPGEDTAVATVHRDGAVRREQGRCWGTGRDGPKTGTGAADTRRGQLKLVKFPAMLISFHVKE